jgi:hypothetical protein
MEIHSAINSIPFSMPRPAGSTPPVSVYASDAALQRDDIATVTDTDADASVAGTAEPAQRTRATDPAQELTTDDERVLQLLKQRDTEVRAHEQAHVAAGGRYVTSSASYSYQTGPDGQRYAIGGEVGIDTASVSEDPAATLEKARTVRRAALAPAEPSGQDLRVASAAATMATNALSDLSELAQLQREQMLDKARAGEEAQTGAGTQTKTSVTSDAHQVGRNDTSPPVTLSARERLEQRIAAFFAGPAAGAISQFA